MKSQKKTDNRSIPGNYEARPIGIKPFTWALGVIWSILVAASLMWNVDQTRQGILDIARSQARVAYEKDVIYRRWNSFYGGVFVPERSMNWRRRLTESKATLPALIRSVPPMRRIHGKLKHWKPFSAARRKSVQ